MPEQKLDQKEAEIQDNGLIVASKTLANPFVGGRPLDLAEAKRMLNGKGAVLINIDVDSVHPERHKSSAEILSEINTAFENIITMPSVKDGMKVISKSLEESDAHTTISLVVSHPDPKERKSIILTGSTGLNPSLIVLDSITHKAVPQKPKNMSTFRDVHYTTWDMYPSKIYMLLGGGISDNLTKKELNQIVDRAIGEKKENGEAIRTQDLVEYIALKVRQKMKLEGAPKGRKLNAEFVNDITISAFKTPEVSLPAKVEPPQNGIVDFFKKFFNGELIEDAVFSKSLNDIASRLSGSLPKDEREKIMIRLSSLKHDDESLDLINTLLSYNDSDDVSRAMENKGIGPKEIKKLINNGVMWDLVSVMLDHKGEFRTALSIILSEVPLGAIPDGVRVKLSDVPESLDMEVLPWFENWYLCDMFAGRMSSAMKKDGIIFVNGIPIKFLGKPAGVVLKTETDPKSGDTILEGTIVSPVDSKQRAEIKRKFDLGVPSIQIKDLKLAVMRSWKKDIDHKDWVMAKKKYVEYRDNLPSKFHNKIGKYTRAEWRTKHKEDL